MPKILEGSRAIAETVNACEPGVVSAYPITPQTHIVEELAQIKADGDGNFEFVRAESEFAAASIVLGSEATGVRSYTATSSQGLLLMTEVLFCIAGMRMPVVLTDANRAISAPINIWNDQQDVMTVRDSGWIMLFGETVQEVCDLHILAFKIAEQLSIPVMVNLDGFVLTHVVEPVTIETKEKVQKYLPAYAPSEYLDPKNPLTFGAFATPAHYFEIRQELHDDIVASGKIIAKEMKVFKKYFGRDLVMTDYYGPIGAKTVLVAMGSVLGTMKDAVDEMNAKLKVEDQIAILKIVAFRPFPDEEIAKQLESAEKIMVIDKSLSLGTEGVIATEVKRALSGRTKAEIGNFIVGLGGRDITKDIIKKIAKHKGALNGQVVFVGK
jgi:pyruvate ferredoxin oxidoreductase alpha subunit